MVGLGGWIGEPFRSFFLKIQNARWQKNICVELVDASFGVTYVERFLVMEEQNNVDEISFGNM